MKKIILENNYLKIFKKKIGNINFSFVKSKILKKTKTGTSNMFNYSRRLPYYFRIWLLMSRNSLYIVSTQKTIFFIFLLGKIIRFGFFLAFIYFLVNSTNGVAGYSSNQVIFVFLTFNLVDIISQFFFREVYRFRPLVISGDFDLVLVKPMSSLFRVLMGGADFIDLITIPPLLFAIFLVAKSLDPTLANSFFYVLLVLNGLLIAMGFHIFVLALGIITLEMDHTIMIYRDMMNLGRFPIDIYKEPIKSVITYLIPVGLMITIPAKVMMGLLNPKDIILTLFLGIIILYLSSNFWRFALKRYSSASS